MRVLSHAKTKARPETPLRTLRTATATEAYWRAAGRPHCLHATAILRPHVHGCGNAQTRRDERHASVARPETQKIAVRGMRVDGATARSSSGWELAEQRSEQFVDTLLKLPSEIALGQGRACSQETLGAGDGVGWAPRVLQSHRVRVAGKRRRRDARTHFESMGEASRQIAIRTLAARLAARGSAAAAELLSMMDAADMEAAA